MKLKLFGKKDKSASVPKNAASAEVEEQDNSEGAEGADDSADDDSESDGDSSDEESSSDDGGDDQPGDDADDSAEATQTQMVEQINACTTRIEQQDATIANLSAQLKKLTGDRSKEIDQAASKKAVQQTAAQDVLAPSGNEDEGAFFDKALCRGQADAAGSACDQCDFTV